MRACMHTCLYVCMRACARVCVLTINVVVLKIMCHFMTNVSLSVQGAKHESEGQRKKERDSEPVITLKQLNST